MACVLAPIDVKQMVAVSNILKAKYNVKFIPEDQIVAWIRDTLERAVKEAEKKNTI